MKKSFTPNILLSLCYVFFILCLLIKFLSLRHEYYFVFNLTKWMINYQGNFLLFLYNRFSIRPYFAVSFITYTGFIVLAVVFLKKIIDKGYSIFILPSVFFNRNV